MNRLRGKFRSKKHQAPCTLWCLLCLLVIPALLQGCAGNFDAATPTASVPSTTTAAAVPSITSSPTARPTQTATAIFTRTATLTPTVTITPLPSLTFLPTVPNPREALEQLYGVNKDCQLPCWWVFTPGKTTYDEVIQYVRQFGDVVHVDENKDRRRLILYYPPPNNQVDYNVSTKLFFDNEVVEKIVLDYETAMWSYYTPGRMITEFGKPDEVYFGMVSDSTGYLALLYSERRIFVEYLVTIEEEGGEEKACFAAFGALGTWAGENTAVNQVVLGRYELNPLEDSTSMGRDALFGLLQQQPTSFCFPYKVKQ